MQPLLPSSEQLLGSPGSADRLGQGGTLPGPATTGAVEPELHRGQLWRRVRPRQLRQTVEGLSLGVGQGLL